ncbi:MAG: DNA adenine methylase [Humidesulfovibrio sp.]|nr:DNA adenine methylase [Humidesulfovibrio sp.]
MAFINSPLRYPGGKSSLSSYLSEVIKANDMVGCTYVEPFAGGAGAAVDLLLGGVVERLCLNDADPSIHSFWTAFLGDTERFLHSVQTVPLTMDEWHHQQAILRDPGRHDVFSVGFAAFYMNRTNRSGILTGGPIGGQGQSGKWKLDARFNRNGLCQRIEAIAQHSRQIDVHGLDAMTFLTHIVPTLKRKKFLFLDPPYCRKGQMLYLNAYTQEDHARLAGFMRSQPNTTRAMTYDDVPAIRQLYSWCSVEAFGLNYFAKTVGRGNELFIRPRRVNVPEGPVAVRYNSMLGLRTKTPKQIPAPTL